MSLVLLIILGSLIAFVIISAVIFYYTQEYILFHPTVLPLDHQYEFKGNVEFEEFRFKADKDAVIYGLHFKPKNPKALLFYFHGNSKDVQHWGFWCEAISEKYNLEVVVADYRGFGKSTGTRTIGAMLNDALAVYRFFEHIPLPHIVYGRSLGGAFASHVALVNQIDKLILESTFTRTAHIVLPFSAGVPRLFLLRFPFQNIQNIKSFEGELIIIHGKKDVLVPVSHAKRLNQMAKTNRKKMYLIEKGTHWNLPELNDYWKVLSDTLS